MRSTSGCSGDGSRAAHATLLKTDLFDEAVGRGLYPELAARAHQVIGIDVSAGVVRAAARRYPALDARVADVLALPFGENTFDAIVSNSTLDHFDSHAELSASVRELARTLRPGGRLIITLDNRLNPIVALRTSVLFGTLHRLRIVPYFVGATHGPRGLAARARRKRIRSHRDDVDHAVPTATRRSSRRTPDARPGSRRGGRARPSQASAPLGGAGALAYAPPHGTLRGRARHPAVRCPHRCTARGQRTGAPPGWLARRPPRRGGRVHPLGSGVRTVVHGAHHGRSNAPPEPIT